MKKILVITQDAGGAEILSSLIKYEKNNYSWIVYTLKRSAAESVFRKKNLTGIVSCFEDSVFSSVINTLKPDYFFYSTNWSDSNYLLANKYCKANKIPTVAFLDHWINYKERFGFPGENWLDDLPDFIAVGDESAYQLAEKNNLSNILKLNNYYFIDLVNDFQKLNVERPVRTDNTLLYISQTISASNSSFTYFGKYEDDTIKMILENFNKISDKFGISQFRIRLHPSQVVSEYINYQKAFPGIKITVEEPQNADILSSLVTSKLALGINSMALFIAFLVGKPAISIAPASEKISLPLPQKCRVNDLEEMLKVDIDGLSNGMNQFIYFKDNTLAQLIDSVDRKFKR